MAVLVVLLSFVGFVILDLAIRFAIKSFRTRRVEKERAEALDIGLRLDFTDEAKSLKRVEVQNPTARILAVDDEPVILDTFRKILVMSGYNVDTVECGPEALGLVQKNDYDFVFTDLKMPGMDGIDVVKAAKHYRPDVDVIMITGYATVESAVDAMKYGAMDYVQKPFTEDELVDFVRKSVIRRQDRMRKQLKPSVRVLTMAPDEKPFRNEFTVPGGYFISKGHCWATIAASGMVTMGVDDFAQKLTGRIDGIELPREGVEIKKGETLFALKQGDRLAWLASPVSGRVVSVNADLLANPIAVKANPYQNGWICTVLPQNLTEDLQELTAGEDATIWYESEIAKFEKLVATAAKEGGASSELISAREALMQGHLEKMDDRLWVQFTQAFLNTNGNMSIHA